MAGVHSHIDLSVDSLDAISAQIRMLKMEKPTGPVPDSGPEHGRRLIGQALRSRIASVDVDACSPGDEDAFFVADMGEVYRQHRRWCEALPQITPHYAVKCNPDPTLIRVLANLGCGFDCASKDEIDMVLSSGVGPDRIVYAQPVKTKSFVSYARSKNVSLMTFDNGDELVKINRLYPGAQLLLRIATDDSASLCQLSMKFGASMAAVPGLLSKARSLGLDIAGVAFHVGSGASDPNAIIKAVNDARQVFVLARACGMSPRVLDVGGGFSHTTFDGMALTLSRAIDRCFPSAENPGLRVIAEPGRYYAASAYVLATNVIARRVVKGDKVLTPAGHSVSDWVEQQARLLANDTADGCETRTVDADEPSDRFMLYVNDGVYGNFSNIMFDHQKPVPRVLTCQGRFMYGPTASGFPTRLFRYDSVAEDGSICPTPLTFASDSAASTVFSAVVRTTSADNLEVAKPVKKYEYSIWGPSCDGIDCIADLCELEGRIDVGDWLYFEEMGAYTRCSATQFNGFPNDHAVVYVCSEPAAYPYFMDFKAAAR